MDIKLESEDANFSFPEVTHTTNPDSKTANRGSSNGIGGLATISGSRTGNGATGRVVEVSRSRPGLGVLAKRTQQGPVTLTSQLCTCRTHVCSYLSLSFFVFFFLIRDDHKKRT